MNELKGKLLLESCFNMRKHLGRLLAQGELNQGQFLVLRRIKIENSGGEVGMFKAIRISESLDVPPPAITRILNSLERKGLIERKINTSNRRSITIVLTSKGEKTLENEEKMITTLSNKLIEFLDDIDPEQLITAINRISAFCQELSTGKDSFDDE